MLTIFINCLYFKCLFRENEDSPVYERQIIKNGYREATAFVNDKQYDYDKLKKKLAKYPDDYSFTFKEYKKIAKCFLVYKRGYKNIRIKKGWIN